MAVVADMLVNAKAETLETRALLTFDAGQFLTGSANTNNFSSVAISPDGTVYGSWQYSGSGGTQRFATWDGNSWNEIAGSTVTGATIGAQLTGLDGLFGPSPKSMAVDSQGDLHVAFAVGASAGGSNSQRGLAYGKFDVSAQSWTFRRIYIMQDPSGWHNLSNNASTLILDNAENPHIIFGWDDANAPRASYLVHASSNAGVWNTSGNTNAFDGTNIDSITGGAEINGLDATVDSAGDFHISYVKEDASAAYGDIWYAKRTGTTWGAATEIIDGDVYYNTAIATDSSNHAYVAFTERITNGEHYQVKMATNSGGSFATSTIANLTYPGSDYYEVSSARIDINSSDEKVIGFAHAAFDPDFNRLEEAYLVYAETTPGTWVGETALTGADPTGNLSYPSFALGDDNEVTILVGTRDDNYTTGNLRYAIGTPDALAPPANTAPTVALQNTTTTLAENANTTARTKVADIVITDDGQGTNTLSLAGADSGLFEIDGTELFLIAGASLDFETNPALDVTVRVDDNTVGATPDDTADLTISITDVNEPPTIALQNTTTTLAENADTTARTKVADIVVTDDATGTNTLSLAGADSGLFEIDGTELFLIAGASLDFETNPALDVTVRVDDTGVGATPDDTADLSITITDVNELPTIQVTNVTATISQFVDTTNRVFVEEFVVSDVDAGPHNNNVTLVGADAGLFEIVGNRVYLIAGASLNAGVNPVLDVAVQLDDPGLGAGAEATIDISIDVKNPNVGGLPPLATNFTGFVNENLWLTSRDHMGNYDTALARETPFPDAHIAHSFQGDFNGDGREDIAFQMTNGEVYVGTSTNQGQFNFTLWTTLRMNGVKTLQTGDFNADGLTDLVGVYESGASARLWVYESTGTSFLPDEYGSYSTYGDMQTILVGNFDGVNGDDLAIMNSAGVWWVAKSDTGSTRFQYGSAWEKWDATRTISHIQVGDFNGDGSDDIMGVFTIPAFAAHRSIVVGLSQGNEFDSNVWRRATNIETLDAVLVGDFNNDDNDDVVLLIAQQDWMVGLADPGNGRFGYASWGMSTYTGNAQNVGIGDTNGDGRADIFLRDAASRWHAVESNGSSFTTRVIEQWSNTANWQHVKFGSFGPAPIPPSPDFEAFGDAEFLDQLNGV